MILDWDVQLSCNIQVSTYCIMEYFTLKLHKTAPSLSKSSLKLSPRAAKWKHFVQIWCMLNKKLTDFPSLLYLDF